MKSKYRILCDIIASTRKVFAIPEGELKSNPSFSDIVVLPGMKIRTDELPKVLVFGIASMYEIERKTLEETCVLDSDTSQQNTYHYRRLRKKWDALISSADENRPGVRRAMVQLAMIIKTMPVHHGEYLKTVYR